MSPRRVAGITRGVLQIDTMQTDYVMISHSECEQLLTYLRRAERYCMNARPVSWPQTDADLHAEPTEFYSGASGYARATMGMVIESLERHLTSKE